MEQHIFKGKWITDGEFAALPPRNVFHRQLDKVKLPCTEHRNRHILFRKTFSLDAATKNALLYISADDYYKLYINGRFVTQGPAPSYHFHYNYNTVDVAQFLRNGDNVIAVHTLYQGLINRVWQSGDHRHGLILDLVVDGETVVSSDDSFLTCPHSGYAETGVCGYDTQFLERYDSNAPQVGFAASDFDDSGWENAKIRWEDDHTLVLQKSYMLEFETIQPAKTERFSEGILLDFGSNYVGYLCVSVRGRRGDIVTVSCGQELNEDGTLRYALRANCTYREEWVLSDVESTLDWFDYKSFRYAQLSIPEGVELCDVFLRVRHYPFNLRTRLKPSLSQDPDMRRVWELCVHTQKYGVQEVIQDCMEREKGFYLGDGCYTALTNMILTGDDSMVRKLTDDAFSTACIAPTLVTCMDCSFMQEIAEYPLILVLLVLWHYRFTGDRAYLAANFTKVVSLLDAYRSSYERDGLLKNLDKWCVVEWPANFRHGYDVDILEDKVCEQAHVSLNSYYIAAVRTANCMAEILGLPIYREDTPLMQAFYRAFWDEEKKLFRDGEDTSHISLVGNAFVYGYGLCTEEAFVRNFLQLLEEKGIDSLSFFCTFPVLTGLVKNGREDLVKKCLKNPGTWLRILREGGTTTFEGWGKETKWNTSLFHLTMSYAAVFLADIDLKALFLDC